MPIRASADLAAQYEDRLPVLEDVAEELQALLHDCLQDIPRIDAIRARVKELPGFLDKANRIDPTSGEARYSHPLDEIQDQIGLRIVAVYASDVDPVADRVLAEFCEVEDRKVEQPDPGRFGYEARHFVCVIPPDIRDKHKPPIAFFELQIATLFQHAWAEANHDLGYKPQWELDWEEKRRIAWAAAQAWGADRIFEDLWRVRCSAEEVRE